MRKQTRREVRDLSGEHHPLGAHFNPTARASSAASKERK
jgi:hypothetical protein